MSSTINALTSGGGVAITGDTSGQLQLQTNNGTTAVTIDTAQKVGVNTTSPADIVDVARSSAANSNGGLTLTNTDNSGYGSALTWNLKLNSTAGNWGRINVEAASSTATFMRFFTTIGSTLTEAMRIDSSGNLLVNTTTVYGKTTTANNTGYVYASNSLTNGADHFIFKNDSTTVGSITRVGGTGVAYNNTSDYRLKENVIPMANALEKIALLKPCTYTWKLDGSTGQGFIAHELQAVIPDAVTGEKDAVEEDGSIKPQGIDTSFLVATLTAAIQELNAKVDAQAATITELQARLGA